jgi:hypothetical protein
MNQTSPEVNGGNPVFSCLGYLKARPGDFKE